TRFPQFRADEFAAITYNPTGGMLYASECCFALADRLRARGGTLREGVRVARVEPRGGGGRVALADGTALEADVVVGTAGPWAQALLPDLALPVRATRQQVCYLRGLPPDQFAVGRFPVFLAGMTYYGFPMVHENWLKVGLHTFGETVDPDAGYLASADEV